MRAPHQLAVLLGGEQVALLERTRSTLRLTYSGEHRSPDATPLSLSLPPTLGSHTGRAVEAYLDGLIPDNDSALDAIRRQYGADPQDRMSVLAAIGKDCAGAVQFCLPGDVDDVRARSGDLVPVSEAEIEQRLAELDVDEDASWILPGEHWSLGGTQQKFTLRRHQDRWWLAHGAEPTTHIVKPGIRALRAQALAEHVSMRAAAHLGLDVARTAFTEFKSQTAIVITRFDRTPDADGTPIRRHQEDLCQALGGTEKYEEYGGPSALDVIALLRDASATPGQARANVDRFVDGLLYNTVIGAPDAHARNYAVLLAGEQVELAPLYDVASGLGYGAGGQDRALSMSIGGTFLLEEVTLDAWRRFAETARLDDARLLDRLAALADAVPAAFENVLAEVDDWHGRATSLRERLLPRLRRQAARFC